ncbi:MAG TPA: hypothetical protein VN327_00260 [Pseudonocardiaceae bacterium]|nr:hypothetical protein [Pseudonocardiaceae bacterium]
MFRSSPRARFGKVAALCQGGSGFGAATTHPTQGIPVPTVTSSACPGRIARPQKARNCSWITRPEGIAEQVHHPVGLAHDPPTGQPHAAQQPSQRGARHCRRRRLPAPAPGLVPAACRG